MYRLIVAICACVMSMEAQTTYALTGCPSQVVVGRNFNVNVTTTGQAVQGEQFTLPSNAVYVNAVPGAATTAASKGIDTNGSIVLITGLNENPIQPGVVAVLTLQMNATGNYSLNISNVVQADASGNGVTATVNPPCAVSVLSPTSACDVDGDGVVTSADVALLKSWILGKATPPSPLAGDKNGDGKVNVADVQVVIHALDTGVCVGVFPNVLKKPSWFKRFFRG